MDSKELGCPEFHARLDVSGSSAKCTECGAEYPIEESVLCTDRSDAFMGEFDASRMRQFTQSAREMGWRRAAQELMVDADTSTRTILLDPNRASFIDLLEQPATQSILDLGAVMGAISQQLSKSFDWVDLSDDEAIKTAIKNHTVSNLKRTAFSTFAALGQFKYLTSHSGIVARKAV